MYQANIIFVWLTIEISNCHPNKCGEFHKILFGYANNTFCYFHSLYCIIDWLNENIKLAYFIFFDGALYKIYANVVEVDKQ
jgi:hypothetical protein